MTFNFHLHVAIGLLVFFPGLQNGSAQSVPALRPRTANEVVAHFEKMTSDLKVVRPEEVQHPEKFSPARVDSVLGGLERIAETATSRFCLNFSDSCSNGRWGGAKSSARHF
jgi:hypothetical protein